MLIFVSKRKKIVLYYDILLLKIVYVLQNVYLCSEN